MNYHVFEEDSEVRALSTMLDEEGPGKEAMREGEGRRARVLLGEGSGAGRGAGARGGTSAARGHGGPAGAGAGHGAGHGAGRRRARGRRGRNSAALVAAVASTVFTTAIVYFDKKFKGNANMTSEHFNSEFSFASAGVCGRRRRGSACAGDGMKPMRI